MENYTEKNDEIDLIDLIVRINRFFQRRYILVLTFLILGVIIGAYTAFKKENKSRTYFIAHSTNIPNDILLNVINMIQLNIEDGNVEKLVKDLSLDKKQAEKIKDVAVELISHNSEGTLLKIKLEVAEGADLFALRDGIVSYVSNHRYVLERVNMIKDQQKQLITVLGNKIDQLDNFLNHENNKTYRKDDFVFLSNNSYRELVDLYERKQSVERQLKLAQEFYVVEDIAPVKRLSDTPKIIFLFSFIFLILGLVVSIGFEVRNKIQERLN